MAITREPPLHAAWRTGDADREEDAASLFGSYLIQHCREAALSELGADGEPVSRSQVVDAVDTALHNVMDLLEGFWILDAGDGKRVDLALHVQVARDEELIEDVQVSPSRIDLPIGYWGWVDDFGSTPRSRPEARSDGG